jgi:hypothetical protein
MTNTFSEFIAAYQKATPQIKALIDGEEIGLFVETLLKPEGPANLKSKLIVLISNTILGVTNINNLSANLQTLGHNDAATALQINQFISSKLGTPLKTTPSATTLTETKPEDPLNNLRTMDKDNPQVGYHSNPEELTYTTMQSAILNEGNKKGNSLS